MDSAATDENGTEEDEEEDDDEDEEEESMEDVCAFISGIFHLGMLKT